MTIPGISHPAVPYESTIVVTGASGFIESHVVDQALAAGYKVRATSQSAETDAWLVDHFNKKWGSGSVNIAEVVDMEAEGAFNDVVRGAYSPPSRPGTEVYDSLTSSRCRWLHSYGT